MDGIVASRGCSSTTGTRFRLMMGQPDQKVLVFHAATGGMDMRLISYKAKEAIVRRVLEVPSGG